MRNFNCFSGSYKGRVENFWVNGLVFSNNEHYLCIRKKKKKAIIIKNIIVNTLSYKTISAKKENVERKWFIIDAEDKTLGRMCTRIAEVLRGKHKPSFTPHIDCGDFVIVINADKVRLTGNKWENKVYLSYSNYPGGQKSINAKSLVEKKPFALVENAVRGMLPKNKLGRAIFKKLYVYAGGEHPHAAQKPELLNL